MNNNIAFVDLEIDGKGKIMDAGAVMAGKKAPYIAHCGIREIHQRCGLPVRP